MLTALERDGRAVRARGARDGGKRQPDTWQAVTPDTATDPDHATDTGHATDADEATGQATPATPSGNAGPVAEADRATGTYGTPDTHTDTGDASTADDAMADGAAPDMDTGRDAAGMDAAAVAEARDALTALGAAIGDALTALDRGDGAAALTAIEAVYGGSGRARRLVRVAANGRPRTTTGRARSPRGEMRTKVEAHLAAHPGVEFTAHEVGKALGHSAGAVSNALDRLAEMGRAALVCERPRRFTAAPAR